MKFPHSSEFPDAAAKLDEALPLVDSPGALDLEDLERRIDVLKYQKAAMAQNDYEQQLKPLLVELARVQATLDK